jgi:hypothetical protein
MPRQIIQGIGMRRVVQVCPKDGPSLRKLKLFNDVTRTGAKASGTSSTGPELLCTTTAILKHPWPAVTFRTAARVRSRTVH